jgi:cytochrome oxidase Cu insertion factor (SCO1/SenC/PrrC family)
MRHRGLIRRRFPAKRETKETRMSLRYFRWFGAMVFCACALLTLSAPVGAAGAAEDPFSAMRVRRLASPVPVGNLVLQSTDGRSIRLSDYRGKAVLVEFFMVG